MKSQTVIEGGVLTLGPGMKPPSKIVFYDPDPSCQNKTEHTRFAINILMIWNQKVSLFSSL